MVLALEAALVVLAPGAVLVVLALEAALVVLAPGAALVVLALEAALVVLALEAALVVLAMEAALVVLALEAALVPHLHTYYGFFAAPSPHLTLDIADHLGHSPSLPVALLLLSIGCH